MATMNDLSGLVSRLGILLTFVDGWWVACETVHHDWDKFKADREEDGDGWYHEDYFVCYYDSGRQEFNMREASATPEGAIVNCIIDFLEYLVAKEWDDPDDVCGSIVYDNQFIDDTCNTIGVSRCEIRDRALRVSKQCAICRGDAEHLAILESLSKWPYLASCP